MISYTLHTSKKMYNATVWTCILLGNIAVNIIYSPRYYVINTHERLHLNINNIIQQKLGSRRGRDNFVLWDEEGRISGGRVTKLNGGNVSARGMHFIRDTIIMDAPGLY